MKDVVAFAELVRAAVFATPVPSLLADRPAVVLERIARSAGATRWYYAVTRGDLEQVCERLFPGSAVSFYFDGRIELRPWDDDTEMLVLDLITATGDAVVGSWDPDDVEIGADFVAGANELGDFADGLVPLTAVFVGAFPTRDNDGADAVTIMLPDRDGVTRPHPH